jgi:Helix-turn-helix domain
MKKPTQQEQQQKVLKALRDANGGKVSTRYFKQALLISEVNGRISELRAKGYVIATEGHGRVRLCLPSACLRTSQAPPSGRTASERQCARQLRVNKTTSAVGRSFAWRLFQFQFRLPGTFAPSLSDVKQRLPMSFGTLSRHPLAFLCILQVFITVHHDVPPS